MLRTSVFVGAVLTVVSGAAFAMNSDAPTMRDRQQAACYNDVQRLCGSAMPDVDKVTACMKDKRPKVSAKCSAMWDVK